MSCGIRSDRSQEKGLLVCEFQNLEMSMHPTCTAFVLQSFQTSHHSMHHVQHISHISYAPFCNVLAATHYNLWLLLVMVSNLWISSFSRNCGAASVGEWNMKFGLSWWKLNWHHKRFGKLTFQELDQHQSECSDEGIRSEHSLWSRANTWNVSFLNLSWGNSTLINSFW